MAEKRRKVEFKIDEKTSSGEYANLANIIFSDSEFIIDFARMIPGMPAAEVKSRIILSPKNTKLLSLILKQRVSDYEKAHGNIRLPKGEEGTNIGFRSEKEKN